MLMIKDRNLLLLPCHFPFFLILNRARLLETTLAIFALCFVKKSFELFPSISSRED